MAEKAKDPLWLGVVLVLFVAGPFVFFLVALIGWVFFSVVLLEAAALLAVDRIQLARSGHPFGTWLLSVLVLAGTAWLYLCLGGPQPGIFVSLSLVMALVGISWFVRETREPRAREK